MTDLADLATRMREFTEVRDLGRFHDLKSLTLAFVGEVGEVAGLLQWVNDPGGGVVQRQVGNYTNS